MVSIYILAWASALLVLTIWAMPEPLSVGRVTGRFPRLLLYISEHHFVICPDRESLGLVQIHQMKKDHILLCIILFLLGASIPRWNYFWPKEGTETIMATTLFVSIVNFFLCAYIAVENAVEKRKGNKKKCFSDYCARFSSDPNLRKVAEWLMAITELDSNGNIAKVYPQKTKDDKGHTILKPTYFEKERFCDFLIELNIQIKSEQIEKGDAIKVFYFYAYSFAKVLQEDEMIIYRKRECVDLSELLTRDCNKQSILFNL